MGSGVECLVFSSWVLGSGFRADALWKFSAKAPVLACRDVAAELPGRMAGMFMPVQSRFRSIPALHGVSPEVLPLSHTDRARQFAEKSCFLSDRSKGSRGPSPPTQKARDGERKSGPQEGFVQRCKQCPCSHAHQDPKLASARPTVVSNGGAPKSSNPGYPRL